MTQHGTITLSEAELRSESYRYGWTHAAAGWVAIPEWMGLPLDVAAYQAGYASGKSARADAIERSREYTPATSVPIFNPPAQEIGAQFAADDIGRL